MGPTIPISCQCNGVVFLFDTFRVTLFFRDQPNRKMKTGEWCNPALQPHWACGRVGRNPCLAILVSSFVCSPRINSRYSAYQLLGPPTPKTQAFPVSALLRSPFKPFYPWFAALVAASAACLDAFTLDIPYSSSVLPRLFCAIMCSSFFFLISGRMFGASIVILRTAQIEGIVQVDAAYSHRGMAFSDDEVPF